jgi:hypothetical protein
VWANEEQTISNHIEPALDDFVGTLTSAFLRRVVPKTLLVIAYATGSLRLRQDRSKESIQLYDRGAINAKAMVRENGFDPQHDMMGDEEFKKWLLVKIFGSGSPDPDQMSEILRLLTGYFVPAGDSESAPKEPAGAGQPRNLDGPTRKGPPSVQHDHSPAPYSALAASCEVLILRALEKTGARLLNDGARGRNRDRSTPLIEAHLVASIDHTYIGAEFDFSLADKALARFPEGVRAPALDFMSTYCAHLYNTNGKYDPEHVDQVLRTLA